jgi:hypothetical protein
MFSAPLVIAIRTSTHQIQEGIRILKNILKDLLKGTEPVRET